jgi:hypothetical protein
MPSAENVISLLGAVDEARVCAGGDVVAALTKVNGKYYWDQDCNYLVPPLVFKTAEELQAKLDEVKEAYGECSVVAYNDDNE